MKGGGGLNKSRTVGGKANAVAIVAVDTSCLT